MDEKVLTNVCAYCRVSTNLEEQEQSFENQKKYFNDILTKEKGYNLVEIYADKGLSGTKFRKRKAFNQMLYDAGLDMVTNSANAGEIRVEYLSTDYVLSERKPKFNLIFVKDSTRFARNTEVNRILNKLKDKGVFVYFDDMKKSTENNSDKMLIEFMFSMGAQESIDKSNKVRFGTKRTAEQGKVRVGHELYGYFYNKDENTLRINPKEAKVVKKIFEMRLQGQGTRLIEKYLNANRILSNNGIQFSRQRILSLLKNPTYTGKVVRNKYANTGIGDSGTKRKLPESEWIIRKTDKIDQIIDDDTFNKVQEIIKSNSSVSRGKYVGRTDFAGKLICGCCGKAYHRTVTRKIFTYYVCSSKREKINKKCKNPNITEKLLENSVNIFLKEGVYKKFVNDCIQYVRIALLDKVNNITTNTSIDKITSIKKEIEVYKRQLMELLDKSLNEASQTLKEVYQTKQKEIDENIKILEKELNELTANDNVKKDKIKRLDKIATQIEAYADSIPDNITRKDFITKHLDKIIVNPDKTLDFKTNGLLYTVNMFNILGLSDEEINRYLEMDTTEIIKLKNNSLNQLIKYLTLEI